VEGYQDIAFVGKSSVLGIERTFYLFGKKDSPAYFLLTHLAVAGGRIEARIRNIIETFQSLDQWFSNFHELWPPSKFNWRILNIS